jgi:hypothetical protein
VNNYAEHFKSYRRDVSEEARQYASGLMQAGARKNIYAISEVVPETVERNLQQFITHSTWSTREVLDHVARDADELIDLHKNFVIYEVDPQPTIPVPLSKGPKARRLVTGQQGLSVEEFVQSCSTKDWRVYNVRETTRGSLKLRVLRQSVYVWVNQSDHRAAGGDRWRRLVHDQVQRMIEGRDRDDNANRLLGREGPSPRAGRS